MYRRANSGGRWGAIALAALAMSGILALAPDRAAAQACGSGPLSTSTGNLVGSGIGAVAGGILGNQFGHGSGKGLATGVGVVGGALAGGYVGRSAECNSAQQRTAPAPAAGAPPPPYGAAPPAAYGAAPYPATAARSCRYVVTTAEIEGREQPVTAIACVGPGGWQIVNDPGAQQAADADVVLRTQQRLREQGFYTRAIDGRWGPGTSTAVRNFQRTNGLPLTGQLDPPTRTALGVDAVPLASLAQPGYAQAGYPPPPAAQGGYPPPPAAQGGYPPPPAYPAGYAQGSSGAPNPIQVGVAPPPPPPQ